jgi:hypothetical protein
MTMDVAHRRKTGTVQEVQEVQVRSKKRAKPVLPVLAFTKKFLKYMFDSFFSINVDLK